MLLKSYAMTPAPTLNFDLFDQVQRQAATLNRRAMLWLFGLLVLVAASTVLLAFFLQTEESQDEDRRRAADSEWLDQTVHFHFRRLETDLGVLARQAIRPDTTGEAVLRAGLLWRSPGVIAFHGWVPAGQALGGDWLPQATAQAADSEGALRAMLDITRGLQRAAYAGPLPQAGEPAGLLVWLAVPLFNQGRLLGDYVAAVRLDQAVAAAVPAWFFQDHTLAVAADVLSGDSKQGRNPLRYMVPINLPGAQWRLKVDVLRSQPALAPRAFFGVALLCLAGMLGALYFLWRDMARRLRAESQLRNQMALRSAMEGSITLGLRAWNLQGRLLYANPAFCRMVGWAEAELVGQAGMPPGFPPYWPADQGDEFQWLQQRLVPAAEAQTGAEMQWQHRDGQPVEVLIHGAPLTLADGHVIGWLASALDITERKRVERLAARQQEMLEASARLVAVGEVASTLAHELNQPLGALSSFANGLLNRLQQGRITLDEITPVVARMEHMAEKAGRVIQRVNAFARRQEMTRQPLELTPFIKRVVGNVALPEGLTLQLCLPEAGPTLLADVLLLEHALHNLVLNATEWALHGEPGRACVRVSLAQTDTLVGVRVEDSGPGVATGLQQKIFDAFSSQKAGGMGMGLSICRSIIEAHHGHIDVSRSEALSGAQFTLWLPLSP